MSLWRSTSAGVCAIVIIVAGTALTTVPTPVYGTYAEAYGLNAVGVTATFAALAVGAIGGLVLASTALRSMRGRNVLLVAGGLQLLAAVILSLDYGLAAFASGRFASGVGAGLIAASGTAWVSAIARERGGTAGAVLVALSHSAVYLGLAVGPGAVLLARPRDMAQIHHVYIGIGSVLLVALAVLAVLSRGVRVPAASSPARARTRSRSGIAAGAATAFMTTGMFGSLSTRLLSDLGVESVATSSALLAVAVFVSAAAGVTVLGRRVLAAWAAYATALGLAGVAGSVAAGSLGWFVAAALLSGFASGGLFAMTLVSAQQVLGRGLSTTATVFGWAYAGLALSVVGLGLLLQHVDLQWGATAFAVTAAVLAVRAAVSSPRPGGDGSPGDVDEASRRVYAGSLPGSD